MTEASILKHPAVRLVCGKCGIEAGCNCGVAPITRAEYALRMTPEKSDRAIAAEIGVGKDTVRRARTGAGAPVEKRVGRDGKARRQPTAKREGVGLIKQLTGAGLITPSTGSDARRKVQDELRELAGLPAGKGAISTDPATQQRVADAIGLMRARRGLTKVDATAAIDERKALAKEVPESKRAQYQKLVERTIASLKTQVQAQVPEIVDRLLAKRIEELNERAKEMSDRYHELEEAEENLKVRSASINQMMTLEEFRFLRGLLHPDRAGDDEQMRARLTRATQIFNRLEATVTKAATAQRIKSPVWRNQFDL